MKEKLTELYDGLKERLKSPFILTFILVWTIHHWEFVYSIITFGENTPYIGRIAFLKAYLITHTYFDLLGFPLLWTFASLGIYLVGSFLAEGINLFYSKWVRTFLYWAIDRNKLKTIDDYNELDLRRKALQEIVAELNKKEEGATIKLKTFEEISRKEILELKDQISRLLTDKLDLDKNIVEKNNEIEILKNEIETLKKAENLEIQKLRTSLASDNSKLTNDYEKRLQIIKNENEKLVNEISTYSNALQKFKEKEKIENLNDSIRNQFTLKPTSKGLNNLTRFRELFSGNWLNEFTLSNGQYLNERFHLDSESNIPVFITNNNEKLLIDDIQFIDDSILEFTKTNVKTPNHKLKNKLKIINNTHLSGTENDNIKIRYSKS